MPTLISCELFDYIEIACMFSYKVTLTLEDNQEITGTAISTRTSKEKTEYLVFAPEGSSDTREVETAQMVKMTVLTPGARFRQIDFRTNKQP